MDVDIYQRTEHKTPFHTTIEDEKRSSKRWLVKPIIKEVPQNLWGQYDARTDPGLAGNAVASLLNAPTATSSVPLVMGLSLQPPLPAMSDDQVPNSTSSRT